VDQTGLDHMDAFTPQTSFCAFEGWPVWLTAVAAAGAEHPGTLEGTRRPFVIQQGHLHRTSRCRIATAADADPQLAQAAGKAGGGDLMNEPDGGQLGTGFESLL
jgi:Holliday junction resolvasome RuvABC ATP-dependent DNA helicase subunit